MYLSKTKNGGIRLTYYMGTGGYGWREFDSKAEYKHWRQKSTGYGTIFPVLD